MRKLSRRQLLISLIFPVGITLWALPNYALTILIYGIVPENALQWAYPICLIFCGVLPIILTVTMGIDTGQYILPRIIISGCALAFSTMAIEFLAENAKNLEAAGVFFMIVFTVFSALYFYKIRPTKFSEWIIIFLSNPCLVRLIEYFAQSLTYQRYFEGGLWSTQ